MESGAKEIEEMLRYGDRLYDDGEITQAKDAYKKAMELGFESEHYDFAVDACLRLGPIFSRQNNYADMMKIYDNALVLTRTHSLKSKEPMVYKRVGDGYWRVGALGMAKQYYKKSEDTLHNIEDEHEKKLLSASLYIDGYGNLLDEEGKFREAVKYYKKSLSLLESLDSELDDGRIHLYNLYAKYNMGVAYERHGMSQEKLKKPAKRWFEEGLKHFEEARTMCKKSSYEFAISTLDAAFCYSKLGSLDNAARYTEQAVKILSEPKINAKDLLAWALMNKGVIARELNKFSDAVNNFKEAIEIYEDIGIHEWVAMVYSELGLTYKMMGNKKKSQEAYRRSKALIKEEDFGESPSQEEIKQAE